MGPFGLDSSWCWLRGQGIGACCGGEVITMMLSLALQASEHCSDRRTRLCTHTEICPDVMDFFAKEVCRHACALFFID